MEVGYLVSSLATGGAEAMLLRQVEYADRESTVFRLGGPVDLEPDFERTGTTVVDLDVGSVVSPTDLRRARATISDYDFDVLHAHLPSSMVVARVAGRAAGVDTLVSTHHMSMPYPTGLRAVERATRPLDSHEVAVSRGVRESQSCRFDVPDWSVIYNGIDVADFNRRVRETDARPNRDPDAPVFLNVGRYTPEKGQRHLVEAMASVVTELPDARAVLVGHGPLHGKLLETVEALGLGDSVEVTGKVPVSEIHEYYAMADVFVLPSLNEGLPITGLEALAAELPIVGTRVPGVEEVVTDDVGRLVPPRSPRRLAEAMVAVVTADPESMGDRALERARSRFDIQQTVAAYERLYERLAPG